MKTIVICNVYTDHPGGRYIQDGPWSGEEFRTDYLLPLFDKLGANEKLLVDLDGCFGYATSFLEETFGGLARIYDSNTVLKKLEFKSEEEPKLIGEILGYIKNAK